MSTIFQLFNDSPTTWACPWITRQVLRHAHYWQVSDMHLFQVSSNKECSACPQTKHATSGFTNKGYMDWLNQGSQQVNGTLFLVFLPNMMSTKSKHRLSWLTCVKVCFNFCLILNQYIKKQILIMDRKRDKFVIPLCCCCFS